MASKLVVAALLALANGQAYDAGGRDESAFTYVQPLDTVILDQYGHSEPVYPSRMSRITLGTMFPRPPPTD